MKIFYLKNKNKNWGELEGLIKSWTLCFELEKGQITQPTTENLRSVVYTLYSMENKSNSPLTNTTIFVSFVNELEHSNGAHEHQKLGLLVKQNVKEPIHIHILIS